MSQLNPRRTIKRFTDTIDILNLVLTDSMAHLQAATAAAQNNLELFVSRDLAFSEHDGRKQYGFRNGTNGDSGQIYGLQEYSNFNFSKSNLERTKAACKNLPASFFLALTGAYDDYLAGLVSVLSSFSAGQIVSNSDSTISSPLGGASIVHGDKRAKLAASACDRQIEWLESKLGLAFCWRWLLADAAQPYWPRFWLMRHTTMLFFTAAAFYLPMVLEQEYR